ncbi:MAG TPA: DUF3857 domain-containing protein [Candidatus Binatus sp.]|nr:DUF3857 domain-containing protein [Candidatus Binatus sp.]
MPHRSKWSARLPLAIFAIAGLLALPCRAQGFPALDPDDLKMTSEPKAPGAPAIILFREVARDDSRPGTIHEDNYYRVKVLTEEGRKHGDVEIPFIKNVDEVAHIQARTIKPDGSIVPFDGKVFEKALVKARGIKIMAKTFSLPAVEPGCVIEYSYTLDLQHAYASHWLLSEQLFTRKAQFSLKPYKGNGFMPITLRQSWQHLPAGSTPPTVALNGVVSMEASDIPAFQIEDYMPPPNELKARVDFIYELGHIEDDPDLFWKRVGTTRDEQLEKFIGKHKAIDEAVAQMVSANDPPEVKLHKIYNRVQQIRNTSYEVHKTEQEQKRDKEKIDENVEDVWKRGYGNHMQLDWLFLALVRAAGFEAYGCWAASRAEYFFNTKTEQSGHLNEPVVLVKLNGQDLYFNPGAAFAPFGLLNWSETGTAALRLDKDGGTWVKTTLPKSSESRVERAAKLRLTDAGNLEGTLKVTYTGLQAMYYRRDERNSDDITRKKALEDHVKSQIPVTAEVKLTNAPDWTNPETPLVAEFDISIPDWASSAGKRTVIPAGIFTAVEKRLFEHANRVHPIYIEYPYEKADDVILEVPEGWQVSSVPPPQARDAHVLNYVLKVDKDGTKLHMTRNLTWSFLLLDAKYYPALREFFQTVRTGDDQQIVLQPAAAPAGN